MRTIKCNCGAKVDSKEESNVAKTMKLTGWGMCLSHHEHINWLCPECDKKAQDLAVQLHKVVGDADMYLPTLLQRAGVDLEEERVRREKQ